MYCTTYIQYKTCRTPYVGALYLLLCIYYVCMYICRVALHYIHSSRRLTSCTLCPSADGLRDRADLLCRGFSLPVSVSLSLSRARCICLSASRWGFIAFFLWSSGKCISRIRPRRRGERDHGGTRGFWVPVLDKSCGSSVKKFSHSSSFLLPPFFQDGDI